MCRSITISFSLHKHCLQSNLDILKSVVDLDLFVTNTADLKFPKDENSANILVERLRNVYELTQTLRLPRHRIVICRNIALILRRTNDVSRGGLFFDVNKKNKLLF